MSTAPIGTVIEGEVVVPSFDYAALGAEARIVVQQAATEIRDELDVMRRSAAKIGQRLILVRERLKPLGQWGAWLDREFGWSDQTALNYISVAELGAQNPKFLELESQFARTALTKLAQDSTPPAAREEALRRAEAGEKVTNRDAEELVQAARAEQRAGSGGASSRSNTAPPAHAAALPAVEVPPPFADVVTQLRKRDTQAAYVAARSLTGANRARAMAAVDTLVEGSPLALALTLLTARQVVETQIKNGARLVPVLAEAAPFALTPAIMALAEDQPARLQEDWFSVLYAPSGHMVGKPVAGRDEANLVFNRIIQFLGSPVADGKMTLPFAEHVAKIFGQHFPPADLYEKTVARARALDLVLSRTTRNNVAGAPYRLHGATRSEQFASWTALTTQLDHLEAPPRTPPPLPGLPAGRQPYGASGSGRHVPAVPHVLVIGERRGLYLAPPITRAATIYDTPETVRIQLPAGRQETQHQHKVWAVPDDAAWAAIEAATDAFGARLTELADVLRQLGRYKAALTAAGGFKRAPNPLSLTVARIDDPDNRQLGSWWLSAWHVPRMDRTPVERHTAKMLSSGGTGAYVFTQDNCFLLADDAAWERVQAAHAAVEGAARDVEALLRRLGTYEEALDGRHTPPPATPPPPAELPETFLPAPEPVAAAIDHDAVLHAATARAAAVFAGLSDDELQLLSVGYQPGYRSWVTATRQDLIADLVAGLISGISVELEHVDRTRAARLATMLGVGP